ncbi:hypothetical protein IQ254_23580 [Nodosilinea sp. LEGE 07088]|uniref:hypothetical protein n=1 Tax=Nodosilinea sp. LEGE 07088 TaxID=2777968 RepID=UPI0018822BD7|nr:hypothetical protein [Nodosilinea sp. LEGE 07088]MBE9140142.1 hypothetical protein [Nodosilinea sp. LEGE 07088]
MGDRRWQRVAGIVERGHRVASGTALESPYPQGTIAMQTPCFKALGLDLTGYVQGTLNISISPQVFQLTQPEFTFRAVHWTDRHPPEDFSFSRCRLLFQGVGYDGLVYYPHPETKQRNFQAPAVVEILAPHIPGIQYGCRVEIEYNPLEITVH